MNDAAKKLEDKQSNKAEKRMKGIDKAVNKIREDEETLRLNNEKIPSAAEKKKLADTAKKAAELANWMNMIDENTIIDQLRNVISEKAEVTFKDGSKHVVSEEHAHKALAMFGAHEKIIDKAMFGTRLEKSLDSFQNAINESIVDIIGIKRAKITLSSLNKKEKE